MYFHVLYESQAPRNGPPSLQIRALDSAEEVRIADEDSPAARIHAAEQKYAAAKVEACQSAAQAEQSQQKARAAKEALEALIKDARLKDLRQRLVELSERIVEKTRAIEALQSELDPLTTERAGIKEEIDELAGSGSGSGGGGASGSRQPRGRRAEPRPKKQKRKDNEGRGEGDNDEFEDDPKAKADFVSVAPVAWGLCIYQVIIGGWECLFLQARTCAEAADALVMEDLMTAAQKSALMEGVRRSRASYCSDRMCIQFSTADYSRLASRDLDTDLNRHRIVKSVSGPGLRWTWVERLSGGNSLFNVIKVLICGAFELQRSVAFIYLAVGVAGWWVRDEDVDDAAELAFSFFSGGHKAFFTNKLKEVMDKANE